MKSLYLLPLLALLAAPLSAQTPLSDADLQNAYATKSYDMRISCHDPSIVVDNSNPNLPSYYIYGSHLGHGKTYQSSNYKNWDSSWASGEEDGTANSLFADAAGNRINFADAYGNAHSWQYTGNNVNGMQWAPDIIYNPTMKKWCLYMSLNGDSWCSSIDLFTADSPQGPWQFKDVVIYSGFSGRFDHVGYTKKDDYKHTDLEKVLGPLAALPDRYNIPQSRTTSWGNIYPNNIDPCVFFDDDNNLWMSYGSWSGGIFMLKLDKTTGLRDYTQTYDYKTDKTVATVGANYNVLSDPYFGKKIAGGYYVSGEGSYIQKIGKYYFLFMSYGGLTSTGGYQMRVFRSEKPDGPYVDAYGTPAIYDRYLVNLGPKANDNRGVLLFAGYQWDTMPVAEISQGHNSAFIDNKDRDFVVYHTRFNDGTEGHQVRVHQLFLNEDGWLMAAPYEFNGETATNSSIASKASIDDADVVGDYQFIRHQYNQDYKNKAFEKPQNITLGADGTVTGAETGTWKRTPNTDYITLTLSGVAYKGVLVKQHVDYTNLEAVCISALSSGNSNGSLTIGQGTFTYQQEVWASKVGAKAAIKYTLDKLIVPFNDGATINGNVTLPVSGKLGASVKWTTSDPKVMTSSGVLQGNGPVTLTMTISKDNYIYTREYSLRINKGSQATTPVYFPVSSQKNTSAGWWTNFSDYYTVKAGSAAEFKFYNYSDKVNNWDNWVIVAANNERGATGYAEYSVLRADSYGWQGAKNTINDKTWFTLLTSDYNWDTFREDMDGALVDVTVSLSLDGVYSVKAATTTRTGKTYNMNFVMPIAAKPSSVTLFFENEHSYIDGSNVATGISAFHSDYDVPNSRIYNLNGQQVGPAYHGIVIKNGRKIIQK